MTETEAIVSQCIELIEQYFNTEAAAPEVQRARQRVFIDSLTALATGHRPDHQPTGIYTAVGGLPSKLVGQYLATFLGQSGNVRWTVFRINAEMVPLIAAMREHGMLKAAIAALPIEVVGGV